MELETLRDLYVHELKDLYSAENQIIKALPKMAKATKDRRLASAFNQHLGQTRNQARRLKRILKSHKESTRARKCKGMEGLLKEGSSVIKAAEKDVRDAGLIAAAQRVEHYEMAGYGSALAYAQLLGDRAGARLLNTSLQEEGRTDKKLTGLAKSTVNLRAKKQKKSPSGSNGVAEAISRIVEKFKRR
jgi:ferritin-like metal-binding protein YciE